MPSVAKSVLIILSFCFHLLLVSQIMELQLLNFHCWVCCRLWAEIFEVREENNEILWGRVSDDVVPVNVVCIQDSPETIYQITAYNRLVEKIFDVYLTQPGQ